MDKVDLSSRQKEKKSSSRRLSQFLYRDEFDEFLNKLQKSKSNDKPKESTQQLKKFQKILKIKPQLKQSVIKVLKFTQPNQLKRKMNQNANGLSYDTVNKDYVNIINTKPVSLCLQFLVLFTIDQLNQDINESNLLSNTGNSENKIPLFYMKQFKSKHEKQKFIINKMEKNLQCMKNQFDQNLKQSQQYQKQMDQKLKTKQEKDFLQQNVIDLYPSLKINTKFKVLEKKIKKKVVQNIIEDDVEIEKTLAHKSHFDTTKRSTLQSKRSTFQTQEEVSFLKSQEKRDSILSKRYSTIFTNKSDMYNVQSLVTDYKSVISQQSYQKSHPTKIKMKQVKRVSTKSILQSQKLQNMSNLDKLRKWDNPVEINEDIYENDIVQSMKKDCLLYLDSIQWDSTRESQYLQQLESLQKTCYSQFNNRVSKVIGLIPIVKQILKDKNINQQIQGLGQKFCNGDKMTTNEIDLLKRQSAIKNKCIDNTFIQQSYNITSKKDIRNIELTIAEDIINDFDKMKNILKSKRINYFKTKKRQRNPQINKDLVKTKQVTKEVLDNRFFLEEQTRTGRNDDKYKLIISIPDQPLKPDYLKQFYSGGPQENMKTFSFMNGFISER